MNTTAIKNFAQRARRDFRKLVTDKAHSLGIDKKEIAKAVEKGDALIIHGRAFPLSIKRQRDELIDIVRQQGIDQVVDATAYTLFNRLCALRFMEVHDYLPQRVLSSKNGGDVPDILKNAADVADRLFSDPKVQKEIKELKLAGTKDQELYKRLILAQCNALASAMPFLFEKQQDYSELLMPDNLLHSDSAVRDMVKSIDESDWQEIEIIGWLYQFYISERKSEVIGKVVEKEDIPAATQLFTPKWIVRYMVENSLGRLWLESHPASPLRVSMPYFVENSDDGKTLPAKRFDTPEEIKCMDDACGSGHILVYKFDLLYEMYAECGYPKIEIPALILKNNLYGLDIDERAVQLASFALIMKAREKDARFLEKGVFPNILAIQESNGIDLDAMFNMGVRDTSDRSPFDDPNRLFADKGMLPVQKKLARQDEKDIQRFKTEFQPLVELFHDAKNYGSLLRVPVSAERLTQLGSLLAEFEIPGQLFDQQALLHLQRLVQQAVLLQRQYHICVTNPPYMGAGFMNQALRDFGREAYPDSKADLFSMFIERNFYFVAGTGFNALVTMQSWMFLASFETLRSQLLTQHTIECLVNMANMVMGIAFGTSATVWRVAHVPGRKGHFSYVEHGDLGEDNSPRSFPITNSRLAITSPDNFLSIPGCPIAYWASDNMRDAFAKCPRLDKIAPTREGMVTGNNALYVRCWHEVSFPRVFVGRKDGNECSRKQCRWFSYIRGGPFRKWYGNKEYVVDWESDGKRIRTTIDPIQCRIRGSKFNLEYIFRPFVSWNAITSGKYSARISFADELFDSTGPASFPKPGQLAYVVAFLNSTVAQHILSIINPTVRFLPGDIGSLPFPPKGNISEAEVSSMAGEAIATAKDDWDNIETSWDFADQPLLRLGIKDKTLAESWQCYADYCAKSIKKLLALEAKNNRLFIEAYGLQDELSPDVPEDQITLARADVEKDVRAFISYAIGCMMGRYSPHKQGLQFAGGDWDEGKFKGAKFQPDPDGILPVLGDAYFEDDPTERLAEFLAVTFGKNTLNDNMQFVAQTLGMKGNESPRDAIRRYMADGFFKDHLRTYKKRPIYWLFSSGKEKAFQALVYMHRYTPATLSRMRTAYLHELQNKLDARVAEVQRSIDDATGTAQSNRLSKELIRIRRQQAELLAFDEKLNNIAGQKISIDLDDGVKHNYGLFRDLLAEVKTVCGKDEE